MAKELTSELNPQYNEQDVYSLKSSSIFIKFTYL